MNPWKLAGALAGLSMGGGRTFSITRNNPGKFRHLGGLAAAHSKPNDYASALKIIAKT